MATSIAKGDTAPSFARRGLTRALSVAGATIAAVATWVAAVPVLGTQLLVRFGSGAPQPIGIGFVVGLGLVGSLLGWGLLAVLERLTSRARAVWTAVAVVVLLVSFSLPITAATTNSTLAGLAAMHLAVAAVLIPALRRSSPAQAGRLDTQ